MWIGGLLESIPNEDLTSRMNDGALGETFACLLAKQFLDLKRGDRHFYENGHDLMMSMTIDQLNEIKQSSLSRIICDNTDLKNVQLNPFIFSNQHSNPIMDCKRIRKVSYEPWKF